jgi:hypothetical protein
MSNSVQLSAEISADAISPIPEKANPRNTGNFKRSLSDCFVRKSVNIQEHYDFINRCFSQWNSKSGKYSKRSVIENLSFYAAIQESRDFAEKALKLQAALIKLYKKKSKEFDGEEEDINESPPDGIAHDKGVSTGFKKKLPQSHPQEELKGEIDFD